MVIFYDDKVDYYRVTTDDSEISPMIRTMKSEFETIRANSGWLELEDKQEQKQMKGLVKLYKVRGQSFGVCAVYCGDNVQRTKMIEDVPQNWSTTLRTIFEDHGAIIWKKISIPLSQCLMEIGNSITIRLTFHRTWFNRFPLFTSFSISCIMKCLGVCSN